MQSSGYGANQGVPSLLYFMMTLFQLILKWAIEEGQILVWVYSLLQWNCMARSKNIGELAYHNFRTGDDYIKIRYDKTKADQSGEKVKDKHIYANPFNPLVCPVLSLGIWFALESKHLGSITSVFGTEKTEVGAPSKNYTCAISAIMQRHKDHVAEYIRTNHANVHGKDLHHLQQVEPHAHPQ